MVEKFNDEELQDIAFKMDFDYDDIPGETRSTRAISMVRLAQRKGLSTRLAELIKTLRPTDDKR